MALPALARFREVSALVRAAALGARERRAGDALGDEPHAREVVLVEGKVRLVQFADIAEFVADGARLASGEKLAADLIVLATGYKGQEALVAKLFGTDTARRVGPVWGFGEGQELRNMFQRTAQPGLWFIAGSFAQCRIYSKYLALQLKAGEAGLIR